MSTRRFLALAACSSLFLIACNQQASVTPPADDAAMEETTPTTDEAAPAADAGTEVDAGADAAVEVPAAQ